MRKRFAAIALVLIAACASAQAQTERRTLTGELTATAPRASFPIRLEAGEVVTLTTSSTGNVDTVLALVGPDGRTRAENDDVAQGVLTSRIVHVAQQRGAYTAVVTGYGGATGRFELHVTSGLDVGLSEAARSLREQSLTFTAQAREHRTAVNLRAGDVFVASTYALTEELDPTLALVDSTGAILAQNDDRGDGSLNSQIVFEILRTGRYEVVAGTYGSTGIGTMLLSLATDPEAEPPFNFAAIAGRPIANHQGTIDDARPSHEYRVQLAAGQTLLAVADTTGGDLDPVLRLLDSDGYPVALNDDRGDGSLNSALAFTSRTAATYTLVLERYRQSGTSGAFTLNLSSVDASVVTTLQGLIENAVELSGPELVIETRDFRVLYTLEGEDASSQEYARAVADRLQEIYEAQIRRIGWAEPIRDEDGRYRAYVAHADGSMGYTKPVQIVFDNPRTSNVRERTAARTVFVIDNDFAGVEKEATPASLARATATHEFNHVVQFGYDSEEGLNWLYEATASWTETTTVGVDQDATDYTETDFAAPQLCFTTTADGMDYAQWTLLQSMADSHGERIVVRMWENAVTYDGFETMSRTLSEVRTNIPDTIQRWRAQNFARDYDLAPRFPRAVAQIDRITREGAWPSKGGRLEQLGAHYVGLGIEGRYAFTLGGDENMELVALGRRVGEIHVIRLGRSGVFDTTGYDNATLMVLNRALPSAPGECSAANYSINVARSTARPAAVSYRFNAQHFQPLE